MSLVKPDDIWVLWTVLIGWAAISIYLEQNYKWAATASGAVVALIGAMVLSNFKVIPLDSPVYDSVWSYVVPLAVPLLLFHADVKKIWKESGRSFGAFHLAALGTALGVAIATMFLGNQVPQPGALAGMFTGTYVGGSVNFIAMADAFKVEGGLVSAAIVADNLLMAIFFFALMLIPTLAIFKKIFKHPIEDEVMAGLNPDENKAAAYWGRKEISLLDIASALAIAITIVTLSGKVADLVNGSGLPGIITMFLGQKYLLITTFTVILASMFPDFFANIKGSQELGTLFIYIFFVVIGVPASITMIIQKSPLLLVYAFIVAFVSLATTLILGKVFKFNLEELLVASNAALGGPTTAAAMAIAKGWNALVLPAMLIGVWGYVIGNYLGIFMGNTLGGIFGF